ncbi:MAG: PadR family transcriptional regulator, partial [Actinomycetota bacterium]|nr:PadR family transcriptional regulator [Actinomycetota bacterium]
GYFWAATHQQIYRTLGTMGADGWVRADVVNQQGRPDKKVYDVTDGGRDELARWIAEPHTGRGSSLTDSRTRDLAVKIRGAAYGDPIALRTQITALREERAHLLDTYRDFENGHFPDPTALAGSVLHQYLVLRGGMLAEEGSLHWLDEVLTALGGTP